jgi:PAT family beta-lactamase induction signal transducer AmpG
MGVFPAFWSVGPSIQIYVLAYLLLDTLIMIAFFAVMMALCSKRVGATQFSLYMAIANMGLSGGAALLGPLQRWFAYSHLFLFAAACALLVVVLLRLVDVERHRQRLTVLDAIEVSREAEPIPS